MSVLLSYHEGFSCHSRFLFFFLYSTFYFTLLSFNGFRRRKDDEEKEGGKKGDEEEEERKKERKKESVAVFSFNLLMLLFNVFVIVFAAAVLSFGSLVPLFSLFVIVFIVVVIVFNLPVLLFSFFFKLYYVVSRIVIHLLACGLVTCVLKWCERNFFFFIFRIVSIFNMMKTDTFSAPWVILVFP